MYAGSISCRPTMFSVSNSTERVRGNMNRSDADRGCQNRVALVYPHAIEPNDAVAKYVVELSELLRKSNSVVVLARSHPRVRGPNRPGLIGRCQQEIRNFLSDASFLAKIAYFCLTKFRIVDQIVFVDVPLGAANIGAIARILSGGRVRTVAWVMDQYALQVKLRSETIGVRSRFRLMLEESAQRSADVVVVLGACMRELIGVRSNIRAVTIPLWVSPILDGQNLRIELGINADVQVFLYAGNAGPNHPLETLVTAFARLGTNSKVLLLLCGSGSSMDQAENLAKCRGLANVRRIPRVEKAKLPELMRTGDVHVASLDERLTGTCLPSKGYAAFAAGRPCLFFGSKSSQLARDIQESDLGHVINTGDVERALSVIEYYISDPERSKLQGSNALHFVLTTRRPEQAESLWRTVLT
jgi:colanic acid biosynthesis glycosyl transferase WcaI